MIISSAPGKVILLGEHAVVHYKLGIAAAIDRRARVIIKRKKENITIESKNLNIRKEFTKEQAFKLLNKVEALKKDLKKEEVAREAIEEIKRINKDKLASSLFVIAKLMEKFNFHGLRITIDSEIPKNLGSSSAIFSAIVLGVSTLLDKELSKKEIAKLANEGDIIAHGGLPSGIDAYTVTYGGYLRYQRDKGIEPLDINFEIPLIIVDSGEPAKTGKTVPYINKLRKERPKLVEETFERLHQISHLGLEAIRKRNLQEIGRLMTDYFQELRKLNISTPNLDRIIQIAIENRALGAKPTGGWGGGCCLVLGKDQKQCNELLKIFQKNKFKAFQTKLGVEGVKAKEGKPSFFIF